jgi:hypothetical protein
MTAAAHTVPQRWSLAQSRLASGGEAVRVAALPVLVVVMVTAGVGPWLGETASGHGASITTRQGHVWVWLVIGAPILVALREQFLPISQRRQVTINWLLVRRSVGLGVVSGAALGLTTLAVWGVSGGHLPGPVAALIAAVPVSAMLAYAPTWLLLRSDVDGFTAVMLSVRTIRHFGRRAVPSVACSVVVVVMQWLVWSAPGQASRLMIGARALVGVGVVGCAALTTRSLAGELRTTPEPAAARSGLPRVAAALVLLVAVIVATGVVQPSVANDHSHIGSYNSASRHGIHLRLHTENGLPTTVSVLGVDPPHRMSDVTVGVAPASGGSGPPVTQATTTSVTVAPYGSFDLEFSWRGHGCSGGTVPVSLRLQTMGPDRVQRFAIPVEAYAGC